MTRTGELYVVRDGTREAVVTELGAGLFRVNWDGTELLSSVADDGFGGFGCHGQMLLPWPGRVAGGRYEHEGETYQLPLDDHTHGAAIHGWARWATWRLVDSSPGRLVMGWRMLAQDGYPFCFDFEQAYAWTARRFEVRLDGVNTSGRPAPIGYGAHPYFNLGASSVDELELTVPASSYVPVDSALNPTGPPLPVQGTPYDFRQGTVVGSARLDVTLADLERDDEGMVTVGVTAPSTGVRLGLHYQRPIDYVQVYSGDTLVFGRRAGLAVEPYTCVPNAFNNKMGLALVPPGGTFSVRWAMSVTAV